jgi:hypothetical protein
MFLRVPNRAYTVQAFLVGTVPVIQRTKIEMLVAVHRRDPRRLHALDWNDELESWKRTAVVIEISKLLVPLEAMSYAGEFLVRPETQTSASNNPTKEQQQYTKGKHQS